MHPDDEAEFAELLLSDSDVQFVDGPRWPTEVPRTTRSLAQLTGTYCIIWSSRDLPVLKAEFIPACNDWYCRTEYATIQFLRSSMQGPFIFEGRIAVATPEVGVLTDRAIRSIEERYNALRKFVRKRYSNGVATWCNPTLPRGAATAHGSPNPSLPDKQLWIGPVALQWLRADSGRRIKQFPQSKAEAALIPVEESALH